MKTFEFRCRLKQRSEIDGFHYRGKLIKIDTNDFIYHCPDLALGVTFVKLDELKSIEIKSQNNYLHG